MFAKVENDTIIEYPIHNIRDLFPNTSFPAIIEQSHLPDGYVLVKQANMPIVSNTQKCIEGPIKLIKKVWTQTWTIVDKTPEELRADITVMNQQMKLARQESYATEADPLFFKWQRGEVTEQDWLDKIQEIKARYPYPDEAQ